MKTLKPFLLGALLVLTSCDRQHPSDAEMIENFAKHRSDFQQLIEMVQADKGLERVDDNWTSPRNPIDVGISAKRIADYRRLFAKCSTPRGFEAFHRDEEILFIANAPGLATGGSSKSYAYRPKPPAPSEIVTAIDTYIPEDQSSYRIYRPIDLNWYLCFEYDD